MFSYIGRIKTTLLVVALLSLALGAVALAIVSRRFAGPVTALAGRVRAMEGDKTDARLGRLGITEIDQLVDAIEELNLNVSRNSARTEFFSRMSHDMRTPMNAIISFSSREMLEDADEGMKDDYLGKIHASGEYLLGLINEVLDMTRIESERMELHTTIMQAHRLFDTTVPVITELARKKGVDFAAKLELPGERRVYADGQRVDQVVMNLLSNAVKFTPAGGRVRLEAVMDETGLCRITVSDTGSGMSREFLNKLYTPFAQENPGHEGSGLGLSIAKKLVELMGGSIECRSAPGEGTTFTVLLPLPPAETADALPEPALRPDALSSLRGRRVLICEDNQINTLIITRLLERVGLEVDAAENGSEGVERFRASAPGAYCAILMDIRMPVMDGLTATRAIRALPREDAATVPILAMTADAFAEDAQNSLAAGMNDHLSKPIETQKLYAALLAGLP